MDLTQLLNTLGIDFATLISWVAFITMVLLSSILGYQAMKITESLKNAFGKIMKPHFVPLLSLLVSIMVAGLGLILLVPMSFGIWGSIAFMVLAGANIDQKSSKHYQIAKAMEEAKGLTEIKKQITESES